MKREVKGFFVGVLTMALIVSMTPAIFADTVNKAISVVYRNIKIYVDGSWIESKDAAGNKVEAFIYNGTTYLPVRAVAEALGKDVAWDSKTNSVYIGKMPVQEVRVSTAEEFVQAIGSNKKIIIEPGEYNLSKIKQVDNSDHTAIWGNVYDGKELIIQNVKNLTIEGIDAASTKFIVTPRFAQIMSFKSCENISISNITAGHIPLEYECDAGVFLFDACNNVNISNSEFYGCGSIGLIIDNTVNLKCDNANINRCSLRAIDIYGSKDIIFSNTKIQDHAAYSNIVYADSSENITFENCDMINNSNFSWSFIELEGESSSIINNCRITHNNQKNDPNFGDAYFFKVVDMITGESGSLKISNSTISGNSCNFLTDDQGAVTFENCTIKNNRWN